MIASARAFQPAASAAGGTGGGDGAQPGDTGQPGMGRSAVGEFRQIPASGVAPALLDRGDGEVAMALWWSESRRSWRAAAANSSNASPKASSWNWALDVVAEPPRGAGVAGQVRHPLVGHRLPGDGVCGFQVRAVGEDAVGDEADASSSSGCGPSAATACPA